MGDVSYATATWRVILCTIPLDELYNGTKIVVWATTATVRLRTWDGRTDTTRYLSDRLRVYEWSTRRHGPRRANLDDTYPAERTSGGAHDGL